MKKTITFLLLFTVGACYAQFSGKITYKDSYESKIPHVSSEAFEQFIGAKRELYLQGLFYKNVHYGEVTSILLYRGNVNRLYMYNISADTIFVIDARNDSLSTVSQYLLEDSDEVILGMKCKKLTITSELGTSIYFFNTRYPINPNDFKNHKFNFWNFYTSVAKAIPLKIIFESKDINFTSTAIEIEQKKLPNGVFAVPNGYLKNKF